MEPTFSNGQVVFYLNPATHQYLPAIIKAVNQSNDYIDYLLDVQAGTGQNMRQEEIIASQDGILTFHEFIQKLGREDALNG